jgi:hypothetical protein
MASPYWILGLLFVACFSLATRLQVSLQEWGGARNLSGDLISALLGDSRRAFANQLFVEADVYLHGGFYPSMFDRAEPQKTLHIAEAQGHEAGAGHGDEDDLPDFMKPPKNWIDRLGRNFYPSKHVHMEKATQEREILPWLLFSAELDPRRVETFTVGAFWLRTKFGKAKEAEQFLRLGLKSNPGDPDILFDLGRLFLEDLHDINRARNVWVAALDHWQARAAKEPEPDTRLLAKITTHLARLEANLGHFPEAVAYLKLLKPVAIHPDEIQDEITAFGLLSPPYQQPSALRNAKEHVVPRSSTPPK